MTQQSPYKFTSVRQSMSDIQNLIRMQEDMKASRIAQNVSDEIEQEQQTVKPDRPITETVDVEADPGTLSRAFDAFGKVMGAYGEFIRPIQLPFIWGSLGAQRAFGDYEEGQLPPGYKESMPAWFGGELPMSQVLQEGGINVEKFTSDRQDKVDESRKRPLSIEERLALTDLPWGVMGGIELLVDPLNFIGGAGVYSKLLRLPKKIPTKTAKEMAENISAGRNSVEAAGRSVSYESAEAGLKSLPVLQSSDELASMGKNPAWVKGLAQKSGMVAVGLTNAIRHINPSSVAVTPLEKGLIGYNRLLEYGDRSWVAYKSAFENHFKAFNISPTGEVTNVGVREGLEGLALGKAQGRIMQDVLERTGTRANNYDDGWFIYSDAQKDALRAKDNFFDDMAEYYRREGIEFTPVSITDEAGEVSGAYMSRGITLSRGDAVPPSRNPSLEERFAEYAVDVVRNGGKYEANPTMILETYYKSGLRSIADERLAKITEPLADLGIKSSKNKVTILTQSNYDEALAMLPATEKLAAILAYSKTMLKKDPSKFKPIKLIKRSGIKARVVPATLSSGSKKWPIKGKVGGKKISRAMLTKKDIQDINDTFGIDIEDIAKDRNKLQSLFDEFMDSTDELGKVTGGKISSLRGKYNEAADEMRNQAKNSYMQGPNEAMVRNRAFAGQVMPKAIAKQIESYVRPQLNPILRGASSLASMSRTLGTTIDWGWIGIQGVLLAHTQPVIFARAVKNMFQSTFSANVVRRYFANPETRAAAEEGVRYGLHLDETAEMVEAARRGAPLERFIRGIPVAGRILSPAMEGFQRAFTFAGNYARIEMWQAMRPMIAAKYGDNVDEARKGLEELADFINKGTGVMSTRQLGITPAQQAFEAVLLFSPRYTRASIGLFSDTLQGGMSGQLARNALAKMTAAGTLWYTALSYAMGEEPKLDPRPSENGGDGAKFMTIPIGGTNVGIGGNILSLIRLQAHVLATLDDDPSAFANVLDTKDQPFSRYLRGKMSPVGSAGFDIATGKTYMGESTLDSPTNFLANVVRPRMIPFWAESALFESPTGGPGMSGEFFGARTFPVSLWDKRNEARQSATEEYMKETFPENAEGEWWEKDENDIPIEGDPIKFESLDPLTQEKILIQYPEVRELEQRARAQNADRKDEVGEALDDYRTRKEDFHDELTEALFAAESEILNQPAGSIKGRTFRDKYDEAMSIYYAKSQSLRNEEKYSEAFEYLDTKQGDKPPNLADVAYGEYMETVVADPNMNDQYGNFNYDLYEARREDFRLEWGDDMLAYVDEYRNLTRTKVPAMAKDLESLRGMKEFQAYWKSHNSVLDAVGLTTSVEKEAYLEYVSARQIMRDEIIKIHPEFKKVERMVASVRVKLREKNKGLDSGLYRFGYTDTVRHPDNKGRELAILMYGS